MLTGTGTAPGDTIHPAVKDPNHVLIRFQSSVLSQALTFMKHQAGTLKPSDAQAAPPETQTCSSCSAVHTAARSAGTPVVSEAAAAGATLRALLPACALPPGPGEAGRQGRLRTRLYEKWAPAVHASLSWAAADPRPHNLGHTRGVSWVTFGNSPPPLPPSLPRRASPQGFRLRALSSIFTLQCRSETKVRKTGKGEK